MNYILDEFTKSWVSPSQYDYLLANGWRHFGPDFFRYNINLHEEKLCNVFPLRIKVNEFSPSKSQRKIIRKCENFEVSIQKVSIDTTTHQLFNEHKLKFIDNIPNSIFDFLSSHQPASIPTSILELRVYDDKKVIAISYMGVGEYSISSIYGMFHPDYRNYSLGIFTMLVELNYASQLGVNHYYHGYCYDVPSFYDYKKKFNAMEAYLWEEDRWVDYKSLNLSLSNAKS